ncbi:MAG: hypothetical protein GXO90_03275 [FCB group bacterium]|nr:hypothetical protein [FCB group bacterium]
MKVTFITLSLLMVYACSDQNQETDCIPTEQNYHWTAEPFKTDFTIQFPSNYNGPGLHGFEGNIFYKARTDSSVEFEYFYCGPLNCEDFGDTLPNPYPDSIMVNYGSSEERNMNQLVLFCTNGEETGIFYHDQNEIAKGKYFQRVNRVYLEALSIRYDLGLEDEVENILRTIQPD